MSVLKEFREFAVKGNVVDMAVGIIIGAAFGKIVSSLVSDVITPPLGYLIGGVDFTKLAVTLPSITGQEPATIRYGVFLQATFDFIIVAFAIFMLVKLINRLRRKEEAKQEAPPPVPPRQEVLLEEIRDLLKSK
jgi:large conductance mechanosensitive channel